MVAVFQMDGHFNYEESNQATKKMKFMDDQRRILFEKYHIPKVVYTIIEQSLFILFFLFILLLYIIYINLYIILYYIIYIIFVVYMYICVKML